MCFRCLSLLIGLAGLLTPSVTFAATKYWIGTPGGTIATDTNWSTTGGSPAAPTPTRLLPAHPMTSSSEVPAPIAQ